MKPILHALLFTSVILALGGCASDSREIVVWTDRIDLVTHGELFNVAGGDFYAVIEYVPSPAEALEQSATRPDVVVADYLGSSGMMESFLVLDRRFRDFSPDASDIYTGLLDHGRLRGRQRLYPISFDLPGVLTLTTTAESLTDFMIDVEELRERAGTFNEMESGRLTRLGYSPRWSPEFLYLLMRMQGVRFAEGEGGIPDWDGALLEGALNRARNWIAETNEGIETERMFEEQYLYDPMPQLVRRERILFAYMSASGYFSMTETRRRQFEIRWLASDGRISVLESMLFAGVLSDSRNKRDALEFVEWLAAAETHESMLLNAGQKRLESFGVLGGFSAHTEVNEWFLPEIYPSLLGKMPPAEFLAFPPALPENWDLLKDQVVEPWLSRAIDEDPGVRSLNALIESWVLQKGE